MLLFIRDVGVGDVVVLVLFISRKTKKNILQYVGDILSSRPTRALQQGMLHIVSALKSEHTQTLLDMGTGRGMLAWWVDMAAGVRGFVITDIFKSLNDPAMLVSMGFSRRALEIAPISASDRAAIAQAMFTFAARLISAEICFESTFAGWLPGKFAALVSPSESERQEALEFCRMSWESLEVLESTSSADRELKKYADDQVKALLWPVATWPREVLVALAENDWMGLPGDDEGGMFREIKSSFSGVGSSLHAELMFNVCRQYSSKNLANRVGAVTSYHHCAFSDIIDEHDATPLRANRDDEAHAEAQLPSSIFDALQCDFSAGGEQFFDEFLKAGNSSWPSPSPQAYMQLPQLHSLMVACGGKAAAMQSAWLSQVVPVGSLIRHPDLLPDPDAVAWVLATMDCNVMLVSDSGPVVLMVDVVWGF